MNKFVNPNLFNTWNQSIKILILSGLLSLTLTSCGGDSISTDNSNAGSCPQVIGADSALECSIAGIDDASACFVMEAENAKMYGVIDSNIEAKVRTLLSQCTNVENIQLIDVPGSEDDDANLRAMLEIHQAGLNTTLLANSTVASGGTDFFLAGNHRSIAEGARIGVHSWQEDNSDGTSTEGSSFPWGHEKHQPYINTYVQFGMTRENAEEFYYFTINAAPADSMHYMSDSEISQYMFVR